MWTPRPVRGGRHPPRMGCLAGARPAGRFHLQGAWHAPPGDHLVAAPTLTTNHAIDIGAPPESVWPWLTQVGWHLGGYYTARWVDRLLFPKNWSSLDQLDPALVRDLGVGDVIPDGEPGTAWFVVAEVRPCRAVEVNRR